MHVVKLPRLAFAVVAGILGFALAAPTASLACQASQHRCPGMPPELASLCHKSGVMAPDCCKHQSPAPERRAADEQQSAATALATTAAPVATLIVALPVELAAGEVAGFSRDGSLHELGLFTLHAVFRI